VSAVGEIMSRGLLTIDAGTPLTAAAERMTERHVGAVLVVDGDALRGILTERDVLRAVASGSVERATVGEWMTPNPETVDASESTGHAAALMIHGGFRHLPVVEDDRLAGIVSIRDLIRFSLDDESPRGV
jgi:CBS domain-containing protein